MPLLLWRKDETGVVNGVLAIVCFWGLTFFILCLRSKRRILRTLEAGLTPISLTAPPKRLLGTSTDMSMGNECERCSTDASE